jgi:hypothetical protein
MLDGVPLAYEELHMHVFTQDISDELLARQTTVRILAE